MKIIWDKVTWYSKLLAVFVFAGAIWLGIYFTNQYKEIKQIIAAPIDTAIDTSNWKTYKNEKYGFEINYPSNFKINVVGMSGINWQINTGTSEVSVGLIEKGQVNCNYDNASEKISGAYAFLKYSGNPTRYVIMTNKDYDFEVIEACGVNRCSNEEYNLQDQIVETFKVTGDTKSLNCAG